MNAVDIVTDFKLAH